MWKGEHLEDAGYGFLSCFWEQTRNTGRQGCGVAKID